jgi:hypothetical protein
MTRRTLLAIWFIVGSIQPSCLAMPASPPAQAVGSIAELWQEPTDLPSRDLYAGPWSADHAPTPDVRYAFILRKQQGTNPGITVTDPRGREWHVKQPPHNDQGAEGPIEVMFSRVLSAIGYHQPPIYFVPWLTVNEGQGDRREPGGRFRLTEKSIKHLGDWSFEQNPFTGSRPLQGLLVILLMFNSSDLKSQNNALYEVKSGGPVQKWYLVRDLGSALGETGRLAPQRGDPAIFDREAFITGVKSGFVTFNYHGWHSELFRKISPEDVVWACDLLDHLSDRQWSDAFRAGGYPPDLAARFIRRLHQKIADGLKLRAGPVAFPAAEALGLLSPFHAFQ